MQQKLTLSDRAKIVAEFIDTGTTLGRLADKYKTHQSTVSDVISLFISTQDIRKVYVPADKISEEDLLNPRVISDEKFYSITGLDPENRWWVGKGKWLTQIIESMLKNEQEP